MEKEHDYTQDIADIRSMMERSSKFLSLSGWAGIMAGLYALAGACIAYVVFQFTPGNTDPDFLQIVILAIIILILAVGTAVFLSYKKAHSKGEKIWNATSRRLLVNMAVPLVAGGILLLVLLSKGFTELLAPLTLLFYGLALFSAAKFTYEEVKMLGIIQVCLGLISSYFTEYGLLFWAIGFGVVHIAYGIYIHSRYER